MGKIVSFSKKPNIAQRVQEYNRLREEKKRIESQMTKLSEELKTYAEGSGTKDDKGSYYAECGNFMIGKQARKSIVFDVPKAAKFFRRKGIPECIGTVEVIDSDAVEQAITDGIITVDDLEKITETKVTYSVDLRLKEEITDTVTETRVAASKKPVLKRGRAQ